MKGKVVEMHFNKTVTAYTWISVVLYDKTGTIQKDCLSGY